MATQTVTEIDIGDLELDEGEFDDGVINFGGADTLVRGTVLARNTSTNKWQIYVTSGGSNGADVPQGVLSHLVEATGSGDVPIRVLIRGTVNVNRLVIDAVGDASTITGVIRDKIRDCGVVPLDVTQVGGALFTDEDS